jgi:predicted GTPase
MIWPNWFRVFWRETLVVLLLALPVLSLLPLGFMWLWQAHAALLWAGVMLVCVLAAALMLRLLRPPVNIPAATRQAPGEAVWGEREMAAWEQVKRLADTTPPLSLTDQDEILRLLQTTIELVAKAVYPKATTPVARFTVPEALLALEQLSRAVRADMLRRLPFAHKVQVSDLLWLAEQRRHIRTVRRIWGAVRLVRFIVGPTSAVTSEVRAWLWDKLKTESADRVQAFITREIVTETGRAAINLYGGWFRLNAEEIKRLIDDETVGLLPAPSLAPIRILLAGQVNAGKSSLINALAGEMRAPVNALPTPGGFQVFQFADDGQPKVTFVDSPGLTSGDAEAKDLDALLREVLRCDLLLWVAAANQPARTLDVRAFQRLRALFAERIDRRRPPVLLVVTHVDQLRPAREWAPPYDIVNAAGAKAKAIRLALEATANALELAITDAIPVGLPEGGGAYNIDLLWARISDLLPGAQQTQLNRTITGRRGAWEVGSILDQAYHGGRALFAEALRSAAVNDILKAGARHSALAAVRAALRRLLPRGL